MPGFLFQAEPVAIVGHVDGAFEKLSGFGREHAAMIAMIAADMRQDQLLGARPCRNLSGLPRVGMEQHFGAAVRFHRRAERGFVNEQVAAGREAGEFIGWRGIG